MSDTQLQQVEIRRLRRLVREYGLALDALIPAAEAALGFFKSLEGAVAFMSTDGLQKLAAAVQQAKEAGE